MTKSLAVSGTTPAKSATIARSIVTDIAMYYGLDKDDEKLDWILRQFGDVIDDLNRRKLWQFNLIESATINTVKGTGSYSVPSDLWRIYSTRKTDDIDYTLSNLRTHTFDLIFQNQNSIQGFPYANVQFNIFRDGTISLFPVPDAAYDIVLRYFKLIDKPQMEETLDMPSHFISVPKYGTLARVAMLVGENPSYWEAKHQEAYETMKDSDEEFGDEDLRFINTEEFEARIGSYLNPNVRPRYLDFY